MINYNDIIYNSEKIHAVRYGKFLKKQKHHNYVVEETYEILPCKNSV
jgi:hypothetical protein